MFPELKPYLTTLAMPPTLLLLGIWVGLWVSIKRPLAGRTLVFASTAVLWLLATPVFSIWLSVHALPAFAPVKPQALSNTGVQAIVVLGGGVETDLPDGVQQLKKGGLDRLRHGITLARQSGLPLMVAGGKGWGASGSAESEADVSRRVAQEAFGMALRWTDAESRDTHENARNARQLLASEGIERIALVTHSWHMPRSVRAFEKAGFVVTPAPMGFPTSNAALVLNWLPSAGALETSYNVLREWLALKVQ